MFKRTRQKVMGKIFGGNPMIHHMLSELFRTHPLKGMITALCLLPVRNSLRPSEKILTNRQTFTMSKEYYDELHGLLHIAKAEGRELIRTGKSNDGGYVMLDDFPGGVAYSFGISDDVSWDKYMAAKGYDVFMYDHTIDGLPEDNPRFHWSKLGISDGSADDERLKTLEELISLNHHGNQRGMILKMDVEGAEWGFLEHVKPETLAQFSQMTFEFHDVINPSDTGRVLNALRKISATHQLIHLHANNFKDYVAAGGKNFASVLEASYALRDKYKFAPDYDVKLPLKIDAPNNTTAPEIELGRWNDDFQDDGTITSVVRMI